jgi:uncharacterized protein YgbK (DUF1537 family)
MSRLLGVIADDFTGACDVGIQFRKYGLETVVLADVEKIREFKDAADIIIVDTETRNLDPKAAYDKVNQTLKTFQKIGIKLVYKKIDSTLRGNIGVELDAVLDEPTIRGVLVASSYPRQGRTVVNGQAYVKGVPLEKTEFAYELLSPVKDSHVQTLMERQSNRKIGLLNLSMIRAGPDELKNHLEKLLEKGNRIIVADAETKEDLDKVAKASIDLNLLPCGSAGLAEKIALSMTPKKRLLVVSGSVNNVTLDQIETAGKKLGIPIVEPDLDEILVSDEKLRVAAVNLADEAVTVLRETGIVTVRLAGSRNVVQKTLDLGEKLGLSHMQVVKKLLSVLGLAVDEVSDHCRLNSLVLIGGDSSAKVMDAIGAEGIRIEVEIFPSISMGRIHGGKHEGMLVVTKAGGFGDKQTLVDVINYLEKI